MTKHKPALPYKVSADIAADAKQFPVAIRDANDWSVAYLTGTVTESHHKAAYIAHAANAYPKLVEALRTMLTIDNAPAYRADKERTVIAVHTLLRELGEDQ